LFFFFAVISAGKIIVRAFNNNLHKIETKHVGNARFGFKRRGHDTRLNVAD
jgi:hypothetical protein